MYMCSTLRLKRKGAVYKVNDNPKSRPDEVAGG